MPATLREHLRYPTDLFEVQTAMWARYHVEDPTTLLEGSQRWDVARDPGDKPQANTSTSASGASGTVTVSSNRAMDPYYTQTALPGETDQSFVITRSFSPASADNSKPVLTGFIAGKSDGDDYGKLVVYTVTGNQALAPSGVMNSISVSNEVSQAITLLNTRGQGSQVCALHVDGNGHLEVLARQCSTQGGQLCGRLPGRDGTGVVVAAHRDAPRRARGIVALEGRVNVGLAALAAQHPQHHAVDFSAALHRVPVDAALPAGDVHDFSHIVLLTA